MAGDSIPIRTYALALVLSLLANVGMVGSMATLGKAPRALAGVELSSQPISIIIPETSPQPPDAGSAPQEPPLNRGDAVAPAPPEPVAPIEPPQDELSVKLGNPDAPESSSKVWLGVNTNPTPGGRRASVDQAQFQPGRPGQPGQDAPEPEPPQDAPAPQLEPAPGSPSSEAPPTPPAQSDPTPPSPPAAEDSGVGPLMPREPLPEQPERKAETRQSPEPAQPDRSPSPQPTSKLARLPTSPKPNPASGEGGLGDERESDAFTIAETMDYRPGRPLAGRGLKIITVRPVYSLATLAVRSPRVALVRIVFGREGKVLRASFVDGRDAGHRDFNEPLMDAVHRWRAEGSQLLKLPQDRPNAGLAVTIRFEMF